MEVLSEHNCEGWLEGYLLTGRHGLFATYEAFALVAASMADAAREVARGVRSSCRGARRSPSLNYLLDLDLLAQRPQRVQPPGPGLHGHDRSRRRGTVARVYLPPDANCLLSVADHCLRSHELREPHHHRQAAAAPVARHRRGRASTARAARRSGSGRAPTTPTASPTSCSRARATSRRSRRSRRRGWLRAACARAARARRQRRRSHDAVLAARASRTAWPTTRSSSCSPRDVDVVLRVPRLPAARSTSSARAPGRRRASTCAATRRRARRRRRSTWSC